MDLEGNVELATLLRGLEQQGMAKRAAGNTRLFTALGAEPDGAEGDPESIGVHWLKPQGRPVGTDGLYAGGAAGDSGAQCGAHGCEPFAGVTSLVNETLG